MRLFRRSAKVTVVGMSPSSFSVDPVSRANALEIDSLRIRFDVKRTLTSHPNKCTIKINGLSPRTQSQLQVKPLRVILHAGYDGVLKLVFDGDMKRAFTEKEGASDVVTELSVGDGHRGFSFARLDRSYRSATVRQIASDACVQMGFSPPPELSKPEFGQVVTSFSSSLPARDALTTVLSPLGYGWSSQNRQMVILRSDQVREGQAFVVDQSAGLVGSPKFKETESSGKGTKTEITFSCLLFPELVPGSLVKVQSEFVNQTGKITDSTCKGDTLSSGEDFITEVKAKPFP